METSDLVMNYLLMNLCNDIDHACKALNLTFTIVTGESWQVAVFADGSHLYV